ncbi:MAG: hypothetical protein HN931_00615 [Desulfobacterales bacterium]|nr:hypothetical protein [Desulfobacterales bacterium]
MKEIKAFIGHSFDENDESLVQVFLNIFTELQKMNIGFSWDHAKEAESKDLAEKVMQKIQDKNLFIGICTKKERVIEPNELKPTWLIGKRLSGSANSYFWKTSDWIIQEIGLAIGREMNLLLLIEKGTRPPGGLQGNHEFITFDRNAPEKSFHEISQTIRNLKPKAMATSTADSSKPEEKTEKEIQEEKKEHRDWFEPNDNWTKGTYEFVVSQMMIMEDPEEEQRISDAYLATEDGQIPENMESWEATLEYYRILSGKDGNLSNLENLAKKYSQNSEVQKYLAKGYEVFKEYLKAGESFQKAAVNAVIGEDQLARHSESVIAFTHSGDTERASFLINKMKELAPTIEKGNQLIVETLRNVAEINDDKDQIFGLTEKLLELTPGDVNMRFFLAYNYSQTENKELSLLHYLKIPNQLRGSGSWNNIGAQYSRFDINCKSVIAYRKAEELGSTIAMSNMAKKLIEAGFLSEAQKICDKAVSIDDYHKNIGDDITQIKTVQEEEDKKEKKITLEAIPVHEYYKDFGHALTEITPSNFNGIWKDKKCNLELEVVDGRLTATGSYEQERAFNALRGLAGLNLFEPAQPAKKIKFLVHYDAVFEGCAAKGTMTVVEEEKTKEVKSLLTDTLSGAPQDILMIISMERKTIRIYKKKAIVDNKFYTLNQIEGGS